jgi:hypothetical protein
VQGRYALIVANSGYDDAKLSRLRSPATDASELARVLHDPEIGAFDVELSVDEAEHVLRRRIGRFFADRKRDDLLFLHFSCHGLKDDSGHLYFATADTEVDHLEATAISAEFVSRQMTRSRSRKVVALLDCCYSGAIARGLQFRAGAKVDVEDHLGGHGRVVITASSAMEYAFEGDELTGEGSPSLFTTAVVRGLESGEADRDQDHLISVDDLYDYVCEQIREVTPHQRPNMLSHLEGALYIARSTYVAPVTPAELSPPLVAAIANPLARVREGAVGELSALLDDRDPGTVAAARAALARLAGDDSRRVGAAAAEALKEVGSPPPADVAALTGDRPAPEPSGDRPQATDRRKAGRLRALVPRVSVASVVSLVPLVLTVLGGLGVAVVAALATDSAWIELAAVILFVAAAVAIVAALVRQFFASGTWRLALGAVTVVAGALSLGAAAAVSFFEDDYGEALAEAPLLLGSTAMVVGGALGLDRRAGRRAPDWIAAVALPAAAVPLIGTTLPWLWNEGMSYHLGPPLEAGVWVAVVLAVLSAAAYLVPRLRASLSPAIPMLAAGGFLLGVVVVLVGIGEDQGWTWQTGYWVMAAGALVTTAVAAVLASRRFA